MVSVIGKVMDILFGTMSANVLCCDELIEAEWRIYVSVNELLFSPVSSRTEGRFTKMFIFH